jgi:hypothetical protein
MNNRFATVDPSEEVVLGFDFTDRLPAGVTLTGPVVVTVTVDWGTDTTPQSIIKQAAQIDGKVVMIGVGGMADQTDYHFHVTCETSDSNTTVAMGQVLPVRKQ